MRKFAAVEGLFNKMSSSKQLFWSLGALSLRLRKDSERWGADFCETLLPANNKNPSLVSFAVPHTSSLFTHWRKNNRLSLVVLLSEVTLFTGVKVFYRVDQLASLKTLNIHLTH